MDSRRPAVHYKIVFAAVTGVPQHGLCGSQSLVLGATTVVWTCQHLTLLVFGLCTFSALTSLASSQSHKALWTMLTDTTRRRCYFTVALTGYWAFGNNVSCLAPSLPISMLSDVRTCFRALVFRQCSAHDASSTKLYTCCYGCTLLMLQGSDAFAWLLRLSMCC